MTDQIIRGWDFTLKAPEGGETDTVEQDLKESFKSLCSKWVFQLEESATGYVHYQGRIRLIKKARLTTLVKTHFNEFKGIHLSPTITQNYRNENFSYVMKQDTRLKGPWADTDREDTYVPVQYRIEKWLPWQQSLLNRIEEDKRSRNYRRVYVLIDTVGNSGKTTFAMSLTCKGVAEYVPPINDSKDLMRMVYCMPTSGMYIIDMTRSMNKDKLFGMYSAVEQIKNGHLYDDRYTFRRKIIDAPAVVIMTNEIPESSYLSSDRWCLLTIKENELIDFDLFEAGSDNDGE